MIVVSFFRDVLDGVWYWLYLIACILAFFYVLGIVADNKREKIDKKLKEKKSYDIESGKEAAIAALESKQVLAVNEEDNTNSNVETVVESATPVTSTNPSEINHETPVTVIDANVQTDAPVQEVEPPKELESQPVIHPNATPMEQARSEEPLVINSN